MTSTQTLQPPGAGLPFFEIVWLRPAFKLMCIFTSEASASRLFRAEAEKIMRLVHTTPIKQCELPILIDRVHGIEDSSRNWSIYMVLDHLRIVDQGIPKTIEALTKGEALTRVIRVRDVKPSPNAGPETIERFNIAVEEYETTIKRLGTVGRSARHAHPWFGPLTAHEWHCLAGLHHRAHRQQIERIKAGLARL
jgi:hypothetical protein